MFETGDAPINGVGKAQPTKDSAEERLAHAASNWTLLVWPVAYNKVAQLNMSTHLPVREKAVSRTMR